MVGVSERLYNRRHFLSDYVRPLTDKNKQTMQLLLVYEVPVCGLEAHLK